MTRDSRPQKSADDRESASLGHGAKIAAIREAAILALLSEPTIEKAAARAGVSERTLRRWLASNQSFRAAYEAARRTTYEAGINRVQALTARAVETLEELLQAKKYPAVRLGAARTVTEIGMHQHDAETIMRKLDEIEAAQRQRRR